MFFKKKKSSGDVPKDTSYMNDLFGVTAKDYYKTDEVAGLERNFDNETLQILNNDAVDFTHDDVRDSYSDSIAEYTKKHYELQKTSHDFTNRNLVIQSQKYVAIIDTHITMLDKLILMYSKEVFKEDDNDEKTKDAN